jgi:hypothetical protein
LFAFAGGHFADGVKLLLLFVFPARKRWIQWKIRKGIRRWMDRSPLWEKLFRRYSKNFICLYFSVGEGKFFVFPLYFFRIKVVDALFSHRKFPSKEISTSEEMDP